ncbi:OmpA family protein [Vibrio sp. TRT 17S01]|uniref:OmpA family protein n=1 Tax=Vibrio sp. TRT 17S01 TaxID=3418505 RepID=UPI003CE771E0
MNFSRRACRQLLLVTVLTSPYAIAEQALNTESPYQWYIGGKVGAAYFQDGCEAWSLSCDRHSVAGGVYAGYQFLPWLSVEGGYTYLGEAVADYRSGTSEGTMYSYDLFAKASYPLTERWSIFSKIGAVRWDAEVSHPLQSRSADGMDLGVGAGLSYRLGSDWQAQIEYQFIDGVGDEWVGQSDHHQVTFGLAYLFGTQEAVERHQEYEPTIPDEVPPEPMPTTVVKSHQTVVDTSLFAFDSSELAQTGPLEEVRDLLLRYPQSNVSIAGFTDSVGSASYNQQLSERRAQAIANYFIESGITSDRITAIGRGEAAPVADNQTAEGRAMNRRVEIVIPEFVVSQQAEDVQ